MIASALAVLVALAGVAALAVALLTGRGAGVGIGVLLDLWTAAGLLTLSAGTDWSRLGVAATLVTTRAVVRLGFYKAGADGGAARAR